MVFSSVIFLFAFLPLALLAYAVTPRRLQNLTLLATSLAFYAWGESRWLPLLLGSIAANWGLGLWIDRTRGTPQGRLALTLAVTANLAALAWFKYAGFIAENLRFLLGDALVAVALPLGISFYTFHALSYVIDVHRGVTPPERSPLNLALYITLFPQLIAGPIVRFHDIAGELHRRGSRLDDVAIGIRRFVVGLAKKVLIANVVGRVADAVFALPAEHLTASLAWLGIASYTLQIYFDFSGYSDMAIGLARVFGFHLLENFDYPYVSRSVTEFWRRWHISLTNWFRDYLYVPLGGNRGGPWRTYRNLLAVFLLCGLWHGASWTFVAWGLYHGIFLVLERATGRREAGLAPHPLSHAATLLVVMLGWVLFRAETFGQAAAYLAALAGAGPSDGLRFSAALYLDHAVLLALVAGVIGAMPVVPWLHAWWERRLDAPWLIGGETVRLVALALLFLASAMQLASATHNPFIYFRF